MRGRDSRPRGSQLGKEAARSGRSAEHLSRGGASRSNPRRVGGDRPPRFRLFVALDLPETVRAGVDAWGDEALGDPALRRVPAENLHIILAFLGHRSPSEARRLLAVTRSVCSRTRPPLVGFRAPEQRPTRGKPRMFVLPAPSPEAEILSLGLRAKMAEHGLHEPADRRGFWPHLTVARVRVEGGGSRRKLPVDTPPTGPLPPALRVTFRAPIVGVYRSELDPRGASHILLGKVELAGSK